MPTQTVIQAAEADARVVEALWEENTGREADRMIAIARRCEAAGYDVGRPLPRAC